MRISAVSVRMALVILIWFGACPNALALIGNSLNYNINFQFNNPGARANAMGGAFIGLADDATAAYTNPAGLVALHAKEISLEYKHATYENIQYGSAGEKYSFDEERSGVSFLSLVIPEKKVTFAAYRHQLVSIESDYTIESWQLKAEADLEVVTNGISVGIALPGHFSLGASFGFSRLDYYFTGDLYFDPPMFRYLVDGGDSAEHYTLSVLWMPFRDFKLGIVYRKGPEFKTTLKSMENVDLDAGGLFDSWQTVKNTFKIPDAYGLGISYKFAHLTVAADVNHILYSDLLKDFRFQNGQEEYVGLQASDYEADDRTEYHIGVEYLLVHNLNPFKDLLFSIRAGYYHKPEHRIRYTGENDWERNMARKGEDDNIFSIGAGFVFTDKPQLNDPEESDLSAPGPSIWDRMQMDAAWSKGEFEQEFTLSLVYFID